MGHIKVENLKKQYVEKRHEGHSHSAKDGTCPSCGYHVVLGNVNFEIEDGELVCIMGPSGCGKSTLLQLMAGFMEPSAGRILLDGKLVDKPSSDYIYVFQHNGLLPWMTVWQNIELGIRNMADVNERAERVQEYIDIVELSGFEQYYPHQLSGGMQRRAELGRAMVVNPELLIMDEPFTGLDFLTHMRMREELVNMHAFIGKSMVMVTHFIDDALVMADRIIMLGGEPGGIKLQRKLDIPHPRNIERNEELRELRDELFLMLGVSYVV